jgi:hypothetical protein
MHIYTRHTTYLNLDIYDLEIHREVQRETIKDQREYIPLPTLYSNIALTAHYAGGVFCISNPAAT